jgi:hypothetical protein
LRRRTCIGAGDAFTLAKRFGVQKIARVRIASGA